MCADVESITWSRNTEGSAIVREDAPVLFANANIAVLGHSDSEVKHK